MMICYKKNHNYEEAVANLIMLEILCTDAFARGLNDFPSLRWPRKICIKAQRDAASIHLDTYIAFALHQRFALNATSMIDRLLVCRVRVQISILACPRKPS